MLVLVPVLVPVTALVLALALALARCGHVMFKQYTFTCFGNDCNDCSDCNGSLAAASLASSFITPGAPRAPLKGPLRTLAMKLLASEAVASEPLQSLQPLRNCFKRVTCLNIM